MAKKQTTITKDQLRQGYAEYKEWFIKKKGEGAKGINEIRRSGLCDTVDGQYFPEMWSFNLWAFKGAPIGPLLEAAKKNIANNKAFFAEEAKYVSHAGAKELKNAEYAQRFKDGQAENERRTQMDVDYQAIASMTSHVLSKREKREIEILVDAPDKIEKKPSVVGKLFDAAWSGFKNMQKADDLGPRASEWRKEQDEK